MIRNMFGLGGSTPGTNEPKKDAVIVAVCETMSSAECNSVSDCNTKDIQQFSCSDISGLATPISVINDGEIVNESPSLPVSDAAAAAVNENPIEAAVKADVEVLPVISDAVHSDEQVDKPIGEAASDTGGKQIEQPNVIPPKKTTKDDVKRKGAVVSAEGQIAQHVISNVLQNKRNRGDVEVENKKLRADLTSMRKRLNIIQDRLYFTVISLTKIRDMEGMPAEAITIIDANISNADCITAGSAVTGPHTTSDGVSGVKISESPKYASGNEQRTRPRRRRRNAQWRRRRGETDKITMTQGKFNAMPQESYTAQIGAPTNQSQPQEMIEGRKSIRKRRFRRQKIADSKPREQGPDAQLDAKLVNAENIRHELREANSVEDLSAAIAKAAESGMKYELGLASKKLTKLSRTVTNVKVVDVCDTSAPLLDDPLKT